MLLLCYCLSYCHIILRWQVNAKEKDGSFTVYSNCAHLTELMSRETHELSEGQLMNVILVGKE